MKSLLPASLEELLKNLTLRLVHSPDVIIFRAYLFHRNVSLNLKVAEG